VVQNKQLLLNLIVTASLAFPGIAAGAFQQEMAQAERVKSLHPVTLPEELGGARHKLFANDIEQPDLVYRHYVTPSGSLLTVMVRQTSIFSQIHDFTDCWIANGYNPEFLQKVQIETSARPVSAQIIATTHNKKRSLALLWFQTGQKTGADRWEWRKTLVTGGMPKVPVCREMQIVISRSNETQHDIQILTKTAADLYRTAI